MNVSSPNHFPRRDGVALVVTLIMLSVITVLAVAFLAVTRRERVAVAVSTDMTGARMAAEAAFARAQAEIVSRMQANTSILTYDFLVSTNQDGATNTATMTAAEVGSLTNDARVPVFINTNRTGPVTYDFRWWIDLNRNRSNEPAINGLTTVQPGEPEWIGVLENPGQPHARNNRFLYRIAFMALPATKSLDINYIHNHGKSPNFSSLPLQDNFLRNHGYGNWEYNLAAFFADLNTNVWIGYNYLPLGGNTGAPFDSAVDILAYRYRTNMTTLAAFPYASFAAQDNLDEYANGPLMTGSSLTTTDNDVIANPWPGSANPNIFFRMDELVDTANVGRFPRFFAAMSNAMQAANSPYDRATYFRMISQMGCDSDAALDRLVPRGNFNNYSNIVTVTNLPGHDYQLGDWVRVLGTTNDGTYRVTAAGPNWFNYFESYPAANYNYNLPGPGGAQPYVRVKRNNKINLNYNNQRYSETACVPWTAAEFFHVVADRLLRSYTNFGIDGIPVYLSPNGANLYTPRVHQILQLTANIFDAGTNGTALTPDWPTIHRPVFTPYPNGTNTDVYVTGFTTNVTPLTNLALRILLDPVQRAALTSNDMVFGHPAIVGAKKGWPNLNELYFATHAMITRKLGFPKRLSSDTSPYETNQMYVFGVDTTIGAEVWNSYTNSFPRSLQVDTFLQSVMAITNQNGVILWPATRTPLVTNFVQSTNIAANMWFGAPFGSNSFRIPFFTNFTFLSNWTYTNAGLTFKSKRPDRIERGQGFYTPDWTLVITNRLRFYLYDTSVSPKQLVDFVNITNEVRMNLITGLQEMYGSGAPGGQYWDMTSTNNLVRSIGNQIATGRNASSPDWRYDPASVVTRQAIAAGNFDSYLTTTNMGTNYWESPFNPYTQLYFAEKFQANDPLVHYLSTDLRDPNPTNRYSPVVRPNNLGQVNERYSPWGGNRAVLGARNSTAPPGLNDYNLGLKDPMVRWSDEWDFPTNKFGNVGWLGRIHRGTPWQTVYFKSLVVDPNDWYRWSGSAETHPTNDWMLADLFTVAVDPNAVRAQLSLNQTNLAAWSAALSGIEMLNNLQPFDSETRFTSPAFNDAAIAPGSPELLAFYQGIQNVRTNLPNQVFSNLWPIFTAPELTVGSPFLANVNDGRFNGLNDVAVERLPQQLISLLTVEEAPRLVVYCWGQSLRPADRSIVVTPGPNFGMCTNYQIVGEVGTKAVLRFERRVTTTPPATNLNVVVESYQVLPSP